MRKLKMPKQQLNNFEDVFHIFEASQNAKGVSETTLNHYKYNLKNISKYLEVKKPFDDVTKSDVEQMVVAMRKAGLAHNSMINWNLAASRRRQCVTDCGWIFHILRAPRPELRRLYSIDHHRKNEPGVQRMERLPPGRRLALPVGASPQITIYLFPDGYRYAYFLLY